MELSDNFAEMQGKLDKPSCFGNWKKCVKCGTCWFWPKCKDGKAQAKKGRPPKTATVKAVKDTKEKELFK